MRRAGRVAAETLREMGSRLRPGINTAEIDAWVRADTAARGGRPSQLGFEGFPSAVCVSRNQVVCHGMPSANERLAPGDIVNIDVTTEFEGWHGDTSATFAIGEVSPEAERLRITAQRAMEAGIAVVRHGAYLGDIGAAIQEVAQQAGFSVVEQFGGHGIGRQMHLPPFIAHTGRRGTGTRLLTGMTFTIEPMLNQGSPEVRILPDGWTVVTVDGGLSAQFEHTVRVTRQGCEVLTRLP